MVGQFVPRKPNLAVFERDESVVVAAPIISGFFKASIALVRSSSQQGPLRKAFARVRRALQSIASKSFEIMASPAVRRRVLRF